jgi:substrate import-associated zinc metallohydrolase lipoprotein
MKYIRILVMTLLAVLTFTACSNDDLNSESIFVNSNSSAGNFDQWLVKNYTDPYNIKVLYRYNDLETDNGYNVSPADTAKAKALAIAIKHVWLGAYDEVAGPDFLKQYSPRVFQFLGSPEYNSRVRSFSVRQKGREITLFNVNALQPDNPYIDQESAFPNHSSKPMDNELLVLPTMHHEFCHILTQTKNYSTEFRALCG